VKPRATAMLFGLLMAGRATLALAGPAIPVSPPYDPDLARPHWRFVGLMPPESGDACPEPRPSGGWTTAGLFPGATDAWLKRFCLYEHAGVSPAPPHVGGLQRLDPDAMALAPMGGALRDALWPSLRDHFLQQAGHAELPAVAGAELVRLAVVDTAATRETGGEADPGTSPHGYTLLNMAKELTCDAAGACRAQVSSRLALAWMCFDRNQQAGCRNLAEGGIVGSIAEVAAAIYTETEAWRATTTRRLVLNLSIGWPGVFGGSEPVIDQMPAPVAASLAALEYASCRGAIVVAAAGNRSWGPQGDAGPLYPAGWEARTAPSFVACQDRGAQPRPADFPGASGIYRPLVHAVGGVDAGGRPLANSRPGGEPRLVAFADHAVVEDALGAPTAVFAGSSVATLVASAAAATVAYYRPDLRPDQVMDMVYTSGADLGRVPAFCLGGAPCPVTTLHARRASLCAAAAEACTKPGSCPALPECLDAAALDLSGVDLRPFVETAQPADLGTLGTRFPTSATCRGERLLHGKPVPRDPCPHWQYYGGWPYRAADPQPGSDPCPNCTEMLVDGLAGGTGVLYVEIDDQFQGELTDATLKCGAETWSLGLGPLRAGDTAVVEGATCDGAEPSVVSFTLDGDTSATSTVLVTGAARPVARRRQRR
jgi:hypothetical protein